MISLTYIISYVHYHSSLSKYFPTKAQAEHDFGPAQAQTRLPPFHWKNSFWNNFQRKRIFCKKSRNLSWVKAIWSWKWLKLEMRMSKPLSRWIFELFSFSMRTFCSKRRMTIIQCALRFSGSGGHSGYFVYMSFGPIENFLEAC